MLIVLFNTFLILIFWGVPLNYVNVPQYVCAQIGFFVVFAFSFWGVIRYVLFDKKTLYKNILLIFIGYTFLVTVISNVFFIPQAASGWLPGLIYLSPLLYIFGATTFKFNISSVLNAIVLASAVASIMVIVDRVFPTDYLLPYLHFSGYESERRIVLLHNETAIAIVICFSNILGRSSTSLKRIVSCALLPVLFYSLVVVSESRLAIGAAAIGLAWVLLLTNRSVFKPVILAAALIGLSVVTPIAVNNYILPMSSTTLSDDTSVMTRRAIASYFETQFDRTHGLGFGLMSLSKNKPNVLSNGLYLAAESYGYKRYFFSLVDTRILGALYQFGYIGLLAVALMSLLCFYDMAAFTFTTRELHHEEIGAVAGVMLGFLASPLPANLFTSENTVMIGGLLWFLGDAARRSRASASKAFN